MNRYEKIQTRLREVVGTSSRSLGTTWSFRRMTSAYGIEPRTYDAVWMLFTGLGTAGSFQELYDQDRREWRRAEVQRLRSADNEILPPLKNGDQVKDAEGAVWAVVGSPTSGPGSVAYTLERDKPLLADQDRKGGV